jgi:hypothetical protein
MSKQFVIITAALAMFSAALLLSGSAQAGASASAPSKVNRANQLTAQQTTVRHARRNDFGITEYSSSSARNQH